MSSFADLWPMYSPALPYEPGTVLHCRHELRYVYRERTFVIAALARTMVDYAEDLGNDTPAWLARHVGPWEDDWRWIVCIDLGTSIGLAGKIGVVTWHIHDSELTLFRFLNQRTAPDYEYDGHETAEKYRRVWQYVTGER